MTPVDKSYTTFDIILIGNFSSVIDYYILRDEYSTPNEAHNLNSKRVFQLINENHFNKSSIWVVECYIQGVSGGTVNILEGGSTEYSE